MAKKQEFIPEYVSYSTRRISEIQADESIRCERVDTQSLVLPYGARLPESLDARIARIVKSAYGQAPNEDGEESWDDVNDFEVDDDLFPASQYEDDDYTPAPPGVQRPAPEPAPAVVSPAPAVSNAEPGAE